MKKILRTVAVILLSISVIFSLFSCGEPELYLRWFVFKNISYSEDYDVFTPENSFTTVEDVVIIPNIQVIFDDGYTIHFQLWSKTGKESVQINNVLIKDDETVLVDYDEIDKEVHREEYSKGFNDKEFKEKVPGKFRRFLHVGLIAEDSFEMLYGKEYTFVIEVEVTKNDTPVLKTINYTFVIERYTFSAII